jgi:hypothetical protein
MPTIRAKWTNVYACILLVLCLSISLPALGGETEKGRSKDWSEEVNAEEIRIAAPFAGSEITVGISRRTAAAIDSLTWRGKEFVNAHDHGREIQSAVSLDGYGECYNPTEAGSNRDGVGRESSSKPLSVKAGRNWLETRSTMAFWLQPGERTGSCPKGLASYTSSLSDIELIKRVALGVNGVPNAIEYRASFRVATVHASATFEAVTAYLKHEFSKFWTVDARSGRLLPLSDGPAEQSSPIVFSTPDEAYALGIWSPSLPQPEFPNIGYGRWRFDRRQEDNATVKLNCVFREGRIMPGNYTHTCYLLVGSLKDVQEGIKALAASVTSHSR